MRVALVTLVLAAVSGASANPLVRSALSGDIQAMGDGDAGSRGAEIVSGGGGTDTLGEHEGEDLLGHEEENDGYKPDWKQIDVSSIINNFLPGAGKSELPCWGTRVPFDCGQAYNDGSPLGKRMCIKEDGKSVTVDTYCAYKPMKEAAEAAGHRVRINSGFRTMKEQTYFWNCYQNCNCNNCNTAASPGGSNHQSGIALDIPVATQPRLYTWLTKHATRYGFVRTVSNEKWHWEFRPGFACDSSVTRSCNKKRTRCEKYVCESPPMKYQDCRGSEVPGSDQEGLQCKPRKACPGDEDYLPNLCDGNTFCCKPVECTRAPGRFCLLKGEAVYGWDRGLGCKGETYCARPQPKCRDHPELGCVPSHEARYGSFAGECPDDLVCPRPPQRCTASDPSDVRVCERASQCQLYGSDDAASAVCGGSGLSCCVTTPPPCKDHPDRLCLSPSSKEVMLYGHDTRLCPGTSVCARKAPPCKGENPQGYMCGDPSAVPEGVETERNRCPAASICILAPTNPAAQQQ